MTRTLVWLGALVALAAVTLLAKPELFGAVVSLEFVLAALHIAIPLALAAIGGAITERSGVVDLALEAKLVFGAFAAAAVAHATGSFALGIIAAAGAGAAVAALQLWFALGYAADQVIVGIALNVVALAGTRFALQLFYGQSANSPILDHAFGDAVLTDPIAWIAVVAAVVVPLAFQRTRWGLRLRAAGDRPDALVGVGVSPKGARFAAGLVGGALAGLGGGQLALAVGVFVADMSSGRGYIAIAMVILAGWRPGRAALACVGIAAAYALANQLQMVSTLIPRDLVPTLPYVLTIVTLAIAGGTNRQPRSLGKL